MAARSGARRWIRPYATSSLGAFACSLAACQTLLGLDEPTLLEADSGALVGTVCTLNSECPGTEVCLFERCSTACTADKDCEVGSRCLRMRDSSRCVVSSLATCAAGCPGGTVCSDGVCRNACAGDADCLEAQRCAAGVCEGTDPTRDPGSGSGGAGAGGRGGAGGTGATPSGGAAGTGSEGREDAGADASSPSDAGVPPAIGILGEPCFPNGVYACAGLAQKGLLVCSGGQWTTNGTCSGATNCDTRPGATAGSCQPILAACAGQEPGASLCVAQDIVACGADLVSVEPVGTCTNAACVSGACVGVCEPRSTRCDGANGVQTCDDSGQHGTGVACTGQACVDGACVGNCEPSSKRCNVAADGVETCDGEGEWMTAVPCAPATPFCDVGRCIPMPSCAGLSATCGPDGESCCTTLDVSGGDYLMGRGSETCTDYTAGCTDGCPSDTTCTTDDQPERTVTVGDFILDKYEVTVGRFRKFVDAYDATPPAPGAGANPRIANSGWSSAWDGELPSSQANFRAKMVCASQYYTWRDAPGETESHPINCVTWYEAFAFCIWDGGRLPTEAEWEYAAAGGSRNRLFPWGSTTPTILHAIYGCDYDGDTDLCGGADVAPVGQTPLGVGYYGHYDLVGGVREWVLDAFAPDWYGDTGAVCSNCANLVDTQGRSIRGGAFNFVGGEVRAARRQANEAGFGSTADGFRCARDVP